MCGDEIGGGGVVSELQMYIAVKGHFCPGKPKLMTCYLPANGSKTGVTWVTGVIEGVFMGVFICEGVCIRQSDS